MQSVMTPQQLFSKVSKPEIQRSSFDRSHGYKTTFNAGKLVPIFVDIAVPGDTFNCKPSVFGRLSTPLKPIMDNIQLDLHFFAVPIRLVWDNFVKFMGEQDNPGDSTDFLVPSMTASSYGEESIFDYLGLPTKTPGYPHSTLILRAINLIWNEWYRDENLQDSVTVRKTDGGDLAADFSLLPRGKRKDYFTSALPFAQKAEPVTIPLGSTAPVIGIGTNSSSSPSSQSNVRQSDGSTVTYTHGFNAAGGTALNFEMDGSGTGAFPKIYADLSAATAQTINSLREAFQIQRMYERDARGGTRYTELVRAHFNVISPDSRLQRPEYIGGGSFPLNINPIAQQSESSTTPQGNLAAMGTFAGTSKGFNKSFTEHEIVIGFISARADLNYQQGLNRMWSYSTRFDFYWPSFAHLGEQAILNKEIYTQGTTADDEVFGYAERYSEMRYKPSLITGKFRSNATASLDAWHLGQDFSALPSLNASFIVEQPPMDRIEAVPAEPDFLLDCYFKYICARPMPTFSTPGLIDHF